jgi:hypothetical protein
MRKLLMLATALLCCSPAFAQVGTVMPPLGDTSSLGADPSAPVGTNGLAPGVSTPVSPVPNGVTGTKHKQRRGGMFDVGDFATGNVRLALDL